MPYGFEDTDTGYIFGSAWNVYNDILPHRDFIYTRPAIPAFFHTIFLWLSEVYGYLLDRSFFYVQVFTYSYLSLKIIHHYFKFTNNFSLYFLALLGAIFSVHNYPPMGWNTTDGLFFWVIALYLLLTKKNKLAWFFGVAFALLGTLSKQSFFFMPLFILGFLIFEKQWKKMSVLFLFSIVWLGIYISLKYLSGSLEPMISQIFTRTGGGDFLNAALKPYYVALKNEGFKFLPFLILVFVLKIYKINNLALPIALILIAAYFSYWFYHFPSFDAVPNIMQLLWLFAIGFAIFKLLSNAQFSIIIVLLGLSWCAAISNGYRTPILYAVPIILIIAYFTNGNKLYYKVNSYTIFCIILLVGTFAYGYQKPYRDDPKKELVYNMELVFPQLAFIKSDKETFTKYSELKKLHSKYNHFTVIPSMPLANYLTKTKNPVGTDWLLDVEINNSASNYLHKLYNKQAFLFVEKDITNAYAEEYYEILFLIDHRWKMVEETTYFKVYKPILNLK